MEHTPRFSTQEQFLAICMLRGNDNSLTRPLVDFVRKDVANNMDESHCPKRLHFVLKTGLILLAFHNIEMLPIL